jgi:hypothetical protein
MTENKTLNRNQEFAEFLASERGEVPPGLSRELFTRVHADLNPSSAQVFGKISLIQLGVGTGSLLFCPQFGIAFTSSRGIMPYLMQFGEGICMLGCGALFTGVSILVGSLILRPEEVRVLRERKILLLASLATLSMGAFLCLGAEVVAGLGVAWVLGAFLGSVTTLEIGWRLRRLSLAGATS